MRTPESIAADVLAIVEPLLAAKSSSHAGKDGR
jgi:hypothetical protein